MSNVPNHTDGVVINRLWDNINQGWLVLKLIECIIIPYIYFLLKPNKVLFLLFLVSLLNIPHNLFGFTAFYISRLYPEVRVKELWLIQALSAAFIRIIEFEVNFKIISSIASQTKSKILRVLMIFCSMGVLAGRVYDVYDPNDFLSYSSVRAGMALVSLSGLSQALFCMYCLHESISKLSSKTGKTSKAYRIMSNSSIRMLFIQFIDVGLILGFLLARTSYYSLWIHWVFDNLDNCRSLLLLMDVVCTKLVPMDTLNQATSKITGFEATNMEIK